MLAYTEDWIRNGERAGVVSGRKGWKGGGDEEPQEPHPQSRYPRPAPCSQGRGGPHNEAGAWGARLPGSTAPGVPASHQSPPGCSGLTGLGRAGLHPSGALALSPSPSRPRGGHHAPNVTRRRHPEGGGRREDSHVTSRRTFAALALVSRWTPNSGG